LKRATGGEKKKGPLKNLSEAEEEKDCRGNVCFRGKKLSLSLPYGRRMSMSRKRDKNEGREERPKGGEKSEAYVFFWGGKPPPKSACGGGGGEVLMAARRKGKRKREGRTYRFAYWGCPSK